MPRVDRGSLALDVSHILSMGEEKWPEILEVAETYRAVAVTKPSIVSVWAPGRPLRIALGVGSIIYPPEARKEEWEWGRNLLELSAPEWVDGCIVEAGVGREIVAVPDGSALEGFIVPVGVDGPLQLSLAGAYGIARASKSRPIAVVGYIGVVPVVWYEHGERIAHTLVGGEALLRLKYYALLARRCKW